MASCTYSSFIHTSIYIIMNYDSPLLDHQDGLYVMCLVFLSFSTLFNVYFQVSHNEIWKLPEIIMLDD